MNITRHKSVTVTDVARSAGVSVGTVSRVLNGYANIGEENLQRVQSAMATLGYRKRIPKRPPPGRHRGGRTRHGSGNIGVVYTEMGPEWEKHSMAVAYAQGIEDACHARGFHCLRERDLDGQGLPRCIREGKIDGLLVKATRHTPDFLRHLPEGFPAVGLNFVDPSCPLYQIAPDNRGAGFVLTEYLWSRGHRRIAFVLTDDTHPMLAARFHGYEDFLRRQGALDPALASVRRPAIVSNAPESAPPELDGELDLLLASLVPPTAILTANDWVAKGLYSALERRNLRVPDDISVVGFDNTESLCELMVPPLTSYAIPFNETAMAAAALLLDRIETPALPQERGVRLIAGRIVERASVRDAA